MWFEVLLIVMICYYREGLFDFIFEIVVCCFYVVNVVFVSCFFFCLNIGIFEDENGLVIDKFCLICYFLRLLEKWSWFGENCMVIFDEWGDYIFDIDDFSKEEVLKLLY